MSFRYRAGLVRLILTGAGAAGLIWGILRMEVHPGPMVVLLALTVLVRSVEIKLPQGDAANIDAALAVATILVLPLPSAVVIGALGALIPSFWLHGQLEIGPGLESAARRSVSLLAAGAFLAGDSVVGGDLLGIGEGLGLARVGFVATVFIVAQLILDQLSMSLSRGAPFWPSVAGAIRPVGLMYVSLGAIGVLMALMYESLGIYSLILFSVPLVVVYYAFELLLSVKNTYRQTIAALTRAIGVEDTELRGHGERVADVAVSIGRELGLHGEKLESLGYVGLLHDIGRLGLDEDSFDSYLDQRGKNSPLPPHAVVGSEILSQVEMLRPFARAVRDHHVPYSSAGAGTPVPLESRIISVADEYDNRVVGSEGYRKQTALQALDSLKGDSEAFDPRVVRALSRVVARQAPGTRA